MDDRKIKMFVRSGEVGDGEERQAILDWLTPIDYAAQQSDYLRSQYTTTSRWFLGSPQYLSWLKADKQTLFCPGKAGAGKTTMTAIVINDLTAQFSDDPTVGIAYVYCNYQLQDKQKVEDLLASLLKQLSRGQSSLPRSVNDLYRHKYEGTRPSLEEISKTLRSVAAIYSKTFIIVDALDECQVLDGSQTRFLLELFSLQTRANTNILVTSRFTPEIASLFRGKVTLEIRANGEDIARYLTDRMEQLPTFIEHNDELKKKIVTRITEAADGVFLLAKLHLDSLMKETAGEVQEFLENLAVRPETLTQALTQAYEQTMQRIEGQRPDFRRLAQQVLSWISCAIRVLTTSELQHALAVKAGVYELDQENLVMLEYIVSVCAGLVQVDEQNKIQFVHTTAQEYFERTQKDWLTNAENNITETCVTYLSFDAFESGFCKTDEAFQTRLRLYPLYDYAARYWDCHYRAAASPNMERPVLELLGNGAKVSAFYQAKSASGSGPGYSQKGPREITGLHLSAHLGLTNITKILLDNRHDPNSTDSDNRTPLWAAIEGQNEEVMKLLAKGDRVTFRMLMREREKNLIKSLLNAACNDLQDFQQKTPLHTAVEFDDLDTAKEAISSGVSINAKDSDGSTSLLLAVRLAVRLKKQDFVELLLRNSADARGVKAEDWIKAYGRQGSDIVQLSEDERGKKSVFFYRPGESNPDPESAQIPMQPGTEKRIFIFYSRLPQWTRPRDLDIPLNELIHRPTPTDGGRIVRHFVAVSFPLVPDPVNAKAFVETSDHLEQIWIMWTMRRNWNGEERWTSTDHYSVLPDGWIPDGGAEFFQLFIVHLKQRWEELCNIGDTYLTKSRSSVLLIKGNDFKLINRLLEDAQVWIGLRTSLQQHISKARNIWTELSRYNESKALDELTKTINDFEDVVKNRLLKLDAESATLIGILFNLTSIAEAQNEIENTEKHATRQHELTESMVNLTNRLSQDSSNMKVIAILTALFLPGTFMAILLTTPMFKWPDPSDGRIIVRLPFEIYWAASLSITLILGLSMYIWAVIEKQDEWSRMVAAIPWVGAGKLFAMVAKKTPDAATTKRNSDAALAANPPLTPAVVEITAGNPNTAEPKTESKSDIEAGTIGADTANRNERSSTCTVM